MPGTHEFTHLTVRSAPDLTEKQDTISSSKVPGLRGVVTTRRKGSRRVKVRVQNVPVDLDATVTEIAVFAEFTYNGRVIAKGNEYLYPNELSVQVHVPGTSGMRVGQIVGDPAREKDDAWSHARQELRDFFKVHERDYMNRNKKMVII